MNKFLRISVLVALLLLVVVNIAHSQPPPPPPPDEAPCWPPPCVPVDNGILFAMLAAVAFGALTLFKSFRRTRVAE